MSRLFISQPSVPFKAGDLDSLRRELTRQDSATLVYDADSPELLCLDHEGRTLVGKLQLSAPVFRRVCRLMGPGLMTILGDLSGTQVLGRRLEPDCYSLADAAEIFNAVLRLRGPATLANFYLIRDVDQGTVDGAYSSNYIRLPNIDFLERCLDAAEIGGGRFDSATLVGRWLAVHCVVDEAIAFGEDDFRPGFYFANSEVGDDAVRATYTVSRQDGLRISAPFGRFGRIRHHGKRFYDRLSRMLGRIPSQRVDATWFMQHLRQLEESLLGFLGTDDEHDSQLFFRLLGVLRMVGFTEIQGRHILRLCLRQAANETRPADNLAHAKRHGWPQRTGFDILIAAMRAPVRCELPLRERIEQTAFRMLGGRMSFVELFQRSIKK